MDRLIELTRLTVIDIVDNESDGLSSPCGCMNATPDVAEDTTRVCTTYSNEPNVVMEREGTFDLGAFCHAAHGLSLLLIAEYDEVDDHDENVVKKRSRHLLFDGGPEPDVWRSNAERLRLPVAEIEAVVLSHYHGDHSGGLRGAVPFVCAARKQRTRSGVIDEEDPLLVIDMHDPHIPTRGVKVRDRIFQLLPDNPSVAELESTPGAKVELHESAHSLCDGCFYISGTIPRLTSFETGLPGNVRRLDDGNWISDKDILDERYVACKIKNRGVVICSACSHAGIINVCRDGMKRTNSTKLTAVIGGFHLAGVQVENRIDETVQLLKEMNPDLVLAGHCTGWRAKAKLAQTMEHCFQPLTVGGRYVFGSM